MARTTATTNLYTARTSAHAHTRAHAATRSIRDINERYRIRKLPGCQMNAITTVRQNKKRLFEEMLDTPNEKCMWMYCGWWNTYRFPRLMFCMQLMSQFRMLVWRIVSHFLVRTNIELYYSLQDLSFAVCVRSFEHWDSKYERKHI